jgi:hypothetical protein
MSDLIFSVFKVNMHLLNLFWTLNVSLLLNRFLCSDKLITDFAT